MGIPSYFRRILTNYPRLVKKVEESDVNGKINALCMDFNCLIYTVARDFLKEHAYPGPGEAGETWEVLLCKEISKRTHDIWVLCGRPYWLVICLDGVVPMAKIRQQRMRRFKSAWLKTLDGRVDDWDTNCITPGTGFMRRLAQELRGLEKTCGGRGGFVLSTTEEPGEGEHKIMKWISGNVERLNLEKKGVFVYGLDADLILLTMLASRKLAVPLYLLREHTEFGSIGPGGNVGNEVSYVSLPIQELRNIIGLRDDDAVLNYVALMTLMGNDFVPHGLTHRLTEDGHDLVVKELRRGPVLEQKGDGKWVYRKDVVLDIWKRWAGEEERRLCKMIERKRAVARLPPRTGADGQPAAEYESWPLQWDVEKVFLKKGDGGCVLERGWQNAYWTFLHPYADEGFKKEICQEYWRGLHWVLDYYTGQAPVSLEWMFPAWIPPLWSDLVRWGDELEGGEGRGWGGGVEEGEGIRPIEQLAMVLPRESYWLIEDRTLRRLPVYAPQWFPSRFEVHSVGKRWMWECEVLVPVITKCALREAVSSLSKA